MNDDMRVCHWTIDDVGGDSVYDTQCGHRFEFNVGGSKENGFHFCGYCGGQLVEVEPNEIKDISRL